MGVIYNTKDGIGYITIDNPKKANILDRETSNEISEVWNEAWEDRDVRVIILTGSGDKYFCAGHNLATRPEVTEEQHSCPAHL